MADEFQMGSGSNWWDSPRNRFDTGSSSSSSSSSSAVGGVVSFGWSTEMVDLKPSSSMDSVPVSGTSNMVFQDTHKLQVPDSNLQMMGLGLSSQAMDWNQSLVLTHGGKELSSSSNFQQDQTGMGGFQMDPGAAGYGSPSTMFQGLLLGSDQQSQQDQQSNYENRQINYAYPSPSYGINSGHEMLNSWSKFPHEFLRSSTNSPPKQQQQQQQPTPPHSQLQFSNNTQFWNATAAAAAVTSDARSSFFPTSSQPQYSPPTFDEKKPKNNTSEVRELGTVGKKSSTELSSKRPRSTETPSTLPAFKVRKEKMGDRITALQQLVSPFGKTDTASVLSEAIEYIKFLHEQVNVLSTPYMKSGASMQHLQISDKSKDPERPKQDLRSRGLCLVPVSSTFPVTQETTVDFWNPTYGGTFR